MGVLVTSYDAKMEHRLGPHRDSTKHMINGAPIVTMSFGQPRTFRLCRYRGIERVDFPTGNCTLFIMPYQTNKAWTHEIPYTSDCSGQRISVTIRAFEAEVLLPRTDVAAN